MTQKIDRNGLRVDENLGGEPVTSPKAGFGDFAWKVGRNSGRKKAHKHKLSALVNVQMALGQTAGCPRVNRAKKFMCSPRNTGNINFPLWLTGGCPRVVPTFKKFMCSKFMCLFLALETKKT